MHEPLGHKAQSIGLCICIAQALEDALKDKKLCGVVHPYVADALLNRLRNKPNETFEFDGDISGNSIDENISVVDSNSWGSSSSTTVQSGTLRSRSTRMRLMQR